MRKITYLLSAVVLFFTLASTAQNAIDALDDTIDAAETIRVNAKKGKRALRTLTVDYVVNNNDNPNITSYMTSINQRMGVVEEYSDEVNYFIWQAEQANSNIDGSDIYDLASEIEGTEDYVLNNSNALKTAIEAGNRQTAEQLISTIKSNLNFIIASAKTIKTEAEGLKSTPQLYTVRILLQDEQSGNPVSPGTLPGYYAINQDTGAIVYPDLYSQEGNIFNNLPEGTYRFDAYDGYFDGASSQIVTLNNSLVGTDGVIEVTLNYWSE